MAICQHYENRQALLQRIVDDEIGIPAALGERCPVTRIPDPTLERTIDAHVDRAFDRPHIWRDDLWL